MKSFVQPGNVLTVPASAATLSGDVVKIGSIIGIACGAADSGAPLDLAMTGVYTLSKVSADAFAVGDKAYWDATAKLVTKTATSNTLLGVAIAAAAASTGSVDVRLNGVGV